MSPVDRIYLPTYILISLIWTAFAKFFGPLVTVAMPVESFVSRVLNDVSKEYSDGNISDKYQTEVDRNVCMRKQHSA